MKLRKIIAVAMALTDAEKNAADVNKDRNI